MFKIKREMEQTLSTQIIQRTPSIPTPTYCDHTYDLDLITMLSNEQKYMDGKLKHLCIDKDNFITWNDIFWTEKKYIKIKYKKTYKILNNIKN